MEALLSFFDYFSGSWMDLLEMTYEHIIMVLLGVLFALIVGIPLGILCTGNKKFESIILALANMIQVIPSLALLAVLMIIFGLGFNTVVIGLFLYSLLPIIRNTVVGLKEVNKESIEAGTGMGMTRLQLLLKVKFPLSLPFVLAGLRIALVIGIGVATLAPFIGGDGLGREIIAGINVRDTEKIYGGAIFAAILAILVDYLLGIVQERIEAKQ
ncbi:carnitine transport permease OpuCD [Lentibacillus kapialis]|uniref:Carnitine transport permease OpuCD n=1 Tax=Lentibacillus kapialis TaxID=340214 RepID=A0A917PV85_9BACI|nr:ABC transporter permease [Lentibacillus kapialis]GGJ93462.1 carnitine transport permease OpuCD [Lentibacillus kapialis]